MKTKTLMNGHPTLNTVIWPTPPEPVAQPVTETSTQPDRNENVNTATSGSRPKARMWRLLLAELIDRAVPLPFLAFFFPKWLVVVIAYHLLCDCSPQRRSFGKWVCRLRVIHPPTFAPCPFWRAALQRLGISLMQAAWCLWWGILWVLLYELVSFACVWLSPTGQRPEEYLANTQIVTLKVYRRQQQQ